MRPEIQLLVMPFLAAFIVAMAFAPGIIAALKRGKVGQTISEDGPESHKPKAGTPTMGGLIILAGILGAVLAMVYAFTKFLPADKYQSALRDLLAVVLLMAAYGGVGLADDYLTIHPVRGVRGIASKPKAAVQVLLAIAFVMWLAAQPTTFAPILSLGNTALFGGWFYWAFCVVFIVGMANFVNITDGLDGLVSGLTAIAAVGFAIIIMLAWTTQVFESAMLIGLLMAIAGACVAFLWFNTNPAKVFMGDTGALALGVGLPAIAILMHREVLLIIIGLVFILDGLSSALQWAVFKFTRIRTGTGRRVFKKSPIHHHFELSGWPEQSVVVRFWIVGVILAVLAFAGAVYKVW